MSSPILYNKHATSFWNLGIGVLADCLTCTVTEERNGIFELELTYPFLGALFEHLQNDNIIKADAGHKLKAQLFRIKRVTKTSDNTAHIYTQHVFYLAQDLALRPTVALSGNGSVALFGWKAGMVNDNPFTIYSDIETQGKTTLSIQTCENARKALGGVAGSILQVWGGEYLFDNYHVSLLKARGTTANTLIAYGRNITDLEQEQNITTTATTLYPFATHPPEGGAEELVTKAGYLVDSDFVGNFPNRRVQVIDFSDKFLENETPTPQRLFELAQSYIKANDIGIPKVSLKVGFLDLSRTLNAAGIPYEEVNLCDTVPVYFEKLDIKTRAKIVKIEWNVLLQRYDTLELGDVRTNLADQIQNLENNITETGRAVRDVHNYAMLAANGRSTIFFGLDEPQANRIGDLWYKPNGDDTELYLWDGVAWAFVLSTATDQALLDAIYQAQADAEAAQQQADTALGQAKIARKEVQQAFDDVAVLSTEVYGINTDVLAVSELEQGIQISVSHLENDLTQTQSQVTLLSDQLNITVSDVSDIGNTVSTNYTQLSNAINLRVQKGDVINQINVSTEGILIAGQKVHITGQTTIDNAVIKSAMIQSVNATTITAGTLNAANVNIINLNIANLVGDKTTFVKTNWNSISSQVQIDSTGIRITDNGVLLSRLNATGLRIYHPNGDSAGRFYWAAWAGNPDRMGTSIAAYANSYFAIGSMRGNNSGNNIVNIVVDGNTGRMDLHTVDLRSGVQSYGYWFRGKTGFQHAEIEKLSTLNFTTETHVKIGTLLLGSGSAVGMTLLSSNGQSGLFFPSSGGRMAYKFENSWYYFR